MQTASNAGSPAQTVDAVLARFRPHPLHADTRHWPETNCYTDLWINLLAGAGFDPLAGLGFTVEQDYEGDQFTFGKYQPEPLEQLYGLHLRELVLFGDVATHVETQVRQGRVVLVEVDGFHLPDTVGVSYRRAHAKTTIGVRCLDRERRQLAYYHNSGFHRLASDDFRAVFAPREGALPPYAETVGARGAAARGEALTATVLACLRRHVARMPAVNPVTAWRAVLADQVAALADGTDGAFHAYAFHHPRQLGGNFELLASHLLWLKGHGVLAGEAIDPALAIAGGAKTLQFRLARAAARRRVDPCDDLLDRLEDGHDRVAAAMRRELA